MLLIACARSEDGAVVDGSENRGGADIAKMAWTAGMASAMSNRRSLFRVWPIRKSRDGLRFVLHFVLNLCCFARCFIVFFFSFLFTKTGRREEEEASEYHRLT